MKTFFKQLWCALHGHGGAGFNGQSFICKRCGKDLGPNCERF